MTEDRLSQSWSSRKPQNALPPSRAEAILEILRNDIVSGKKPPGQRLNLDELSAEYGVSRMPIRDAIKQLETEGLVRIYPHSRVEVSELQISDIEELFGIRVLLEQKSIERAVPRLTSADLAEMKRLLLRMDNLGSRGAEWGRLNTQFHQTINRACGWPRLFEMIEVLRTNVERYVRIYIRLLGTEVVQVQHWAIYEACVARNSALARKLVGEHYGVTVQDLISAVSRASKNSSK